MKYEIKYRETLRGKLIAEAESLEEAKENLHDQYDKGFNMSDSSTHHTISEDLEIESATEILP